MASASGKRAAARRAAEILVETLESSPGVPVGIGTGSTVTLALEEADRVAPRGLRGLLSGSRVYASSLDTAYKLRNMGVEPYLDLPAEPLLLYIDGADEVARQGGVCMVLKGRGAAMTREKILAYNSKRVVIVVDESKISARLGEKGRPLPIEVLPPAVWPVVEALRARGVEAAPRMGCGCRDGPALTDNHGVVIDAHPWGRLDPFELEALLDTMPGVVGHGFFTGYVDLVLVGRGAVVEEWRCRRTRGRPGLLGWPS